MLRADFPPYPRHRRSGSRSSGGAAERGRAAAPRGRARCRASPRSTRRSGSRGGVDAIDAISTDAAAQRAASQDRERDPRPARAARRDVLVTGVDRPLRRPPGEPRRPPAARARDRRRRDLGGPVPDDRLGGAAGQAAAHERAQPERRVRDPRADLPGRPLRGAARLHEPGRRSSRRADPAVRGRLRPLDRLRASSCCRGSRRRATAGASDSEAVAIGLERTGRIVTAAALLFAIAIGAFATSQIIFIKENGVGTALAVLIDATIIRALLVPSLMELLGKWNWWAPRPLRRLHERIGLERTEAGCLRLSHVGGPLSASSDRLRPASARPSVTSSACSRSAPTGRPLARRVIVTWSRSSSAMWRAVASPVVVGLVARTTSLHLAAVDAAHQLGDLQVLGVDAVDRRERAAEHVVEAAVLAACARSGSRRRAPRRRRSATGRGRSSSQIRQRGPSARLKQTSQSPTFSFTSRIASASAEAPRRRRRAGCGRRAAARSAGRSRAGGESSAIRRWIGAGCTC